MGLGVGGWKVGSILANRSNGILAEGSQGDRITPADAEG